MTGHELVARALTEQGPFTVEIPPEDLNAVLVDLVGIARAAVMGLAGFADLPGVTPADALDVVAEFDQRHRGPLLRVVGGCGD